jgi:hypothetical protein
MSELAFDVIGAEPDRYAAAPTLVFKLRVTETTGTPIHVLALRCQIRIEPQRRRYAPAEEERLLAVFGETPQWGDSLRPFLWTHASAMVSSFSDSTDVDLAVACTYDLDVAAAKYLHSLGDGEVPLILLFNGTVFAKGRQDGEISVDPVPWHKELSYRLPVAVWREMMDLYFPNSGWLRLQRETLDALERYKASGAFFTADQALEALLKEAGAP